jgi:ribose transport system ATP-binding protein
MPALEVSSLEKYYGGVTALSDGNLVLQEGEVHFLMGANGSGKSTLCKIISGAVAPDAGTIRVFGEPVEFSDPTESKARGISVVYQELSLIPHLTVSQNIMLANEPAKGGGLIDRERETARADEMVELFRSVVSDHFQLDTPVRRLPPDERQIVEILKVLATDPQIIIFDEATSSLHRGQVRVFFDLIRDLSNQGKSVIFITHRMVEVYEIGNRATVLRNGATVGDVDVQSTDQSKIVRMMMGAEVEAARTGRRSASIGEECMRVSGLSSRTLKDVSFGVRRGEILGLGGLQGQGQSALLMNLFGGARASAGTVEREGRALNLSSPRRAMREGFAFISGDRTIYGVMLIRPILENMILSVTYRTKKFLFSRKDYTRKVQPVTEQLEMIYSSLKATVNELSGGNQQKVVIGRWLMTDPAIILMDDPTKGIDVHTKEQLYELMDSLCEKGVSIIWHSSDDEELLGHTDRILVFNSGEISDELEGERLTEYELYNAAFRSPSELNDTVAGGTE